MKSKKRLMCSKLFLPFRSGDKNCFSEVLINRNITKLPAHLMIDILRIFGNKNKFGKFSYCT